MKNIELRSQTLPRANDFLCSFELTSSLKSFSQSGLPLYNNSILIQVDNFSNFYNLTRLFARGEELTNC